MIIRLIASKTGQKTRARKLRNVALKSESSLWYDIAALGYCTGILILALSIGHFHQIGAFGEETDFYHAYGPQTERILAGEPPRMTGNNSPGYVYLLAAVTSIIGGDPFFAAKLLTALAAWFLGWITYLLLKALFSHRIAITSTILLLIPLIPFSFLAATDMVGAVFLMLPLWILLRRADITLGTCFLSGVFAGLSYFIRNPTMFVILGIGLSLLFLNIGQGNFRRRFTEAGIFICGVLVTASPWVIMSWTMNESPFSSTPYLQVAAHFYLGTNLGTALPEMALKFSSLWDVLLYDPATIFRKFLSAILYWNLKQLPGLFLQFPAYLFAGAGFLLLLGDLTKEMSNLVRRRLTYLAVILLGYLTLGLVGFIPRYYLFMVPFFFLLVSYFLFHQSALTSIGNLPYTQISFSWLMVFILASFLGLNAFQSTRNFLDSEPRYLYDMAEVLKKRSHPGEVIIDRKPHLGYLSGLKTLFPMAQTAEEWLGKARGIGARYIVYSDRYAKRYWSGLQSLRDPTTLPSNFQLIYHHKPTNTILYEINSSSRG